VPRTNPTLVRAIFETDASLKLEGFISAAHRLTNWVASKDTDSELDSLTLKDIETWLAAHAAAHRDQLFAAKSTAGASGTFQGRTDMYLNSTQYGQMAMALDITGTLATLNKQLMEGGPRRASLTWGGRDNWDEYASPFFDE
jgi:hypothetical protein